MLNGGTIPKDITDTQERPDIVIIDTPLRTVHIYELTVPFERNIVSARERKQDKYVPLSHLISRADWNVEKMTIEIGSRGHITETNKQDLSIFLTLCHERTKLKSFSLHLSKLAILGSQKIFLSRKSKLWSDPDYISYNV